MNAPNVPPLAASWTLDPAVTFLNHGSFGASPAPVLEAQARLRARLEREPVRFLDRELQDWLDEARAELGAFVGARGDDLAFVPNATFGVNTVLNSLALDPGDELLTTDHAYNACKNAMLALAARMRCRVVVAPVPFPVAGDDEIVDAVLARVTNRTRFLLLDHVTSPTALVLPVEKIMHALAGTPVEVMIDGAHAPGMLPLDVEALGAAYYTGNAHKWLCAPKGAAFLWVRRDLQTGIEPLSISHGWNDPRTSRTRFRLLFDWTGTYDPTPFLCIPEALRFMREVVPGGWPEVMERNRALARAARDLLCDALRIVPPAPDALLGSMAAVPLPDLPVPFDPERPRDPLQERLFSAHGIEVPVFPWPAPPKRLLRVSAQVYNVKAQYERLADVLADTFPRKA